jgi:hypothetical protein
MGFLVMAPETPDPGGTVFHLVDGQQRLTTLCLILAAIQRKARSLGFEKLANQVQETYLVDPHRDGLRRYKLLPGTRDRDSFLAAMEGRGGVGGGAGQALDFFLGCIAELPQADTVEGLAALRDVVVSRLVFVYALLDGDNPYNIFKSLNSTGIPLEPSDLIRNFVFMHVPVREQSQFDAMCWRPLEALFTQPDGRLDSNTLSAFFRDFLMCRGSYVPPKQTFQAFEDRYADGPLDAWSLAEELRSHAEAYAVILGAHRDEDAQVERALQRLRALESSTTYPLLLALLARRRDQTLSGQALQTLVETLCGFILRRFICQESSRGYGRLFVGTCSALGEDPVGDLRSYLEDRGYPETRRFREALVTFPLYLSRYAHHILACLEAASTKELVDLTQAQVEHILPQTLPSDWVADLGPEAEEAHAVWLHTLGNLTLSGYNPELTNKRFCLKRQEYRRSNITITRHLDRYDSWGIHQIRSRGHCLAEIAAALWDGPDEPVCPRGVGNTGRPDDVTSTEGTAPRTPTPQTHLEYWTAFREYVLASGSPLRPQKPSAQHWTEFAIGTSLGHLVVVRNTREQWVAVQLVLNSPAAKSHFAAFLKQQEAIEQEYGEALEWRELPNRVESQVMVRRTDLVSEDRGPWPEQHAWLLDHSERLARVLGPKLRALGKPLSVEE